MFIEKFYEAYYYQTIMVYSKPKLPFTNQHEFAQAFARNKVHLLLSSYSGGYIRAVNQSHTLDGQLIAQSFVHNPIRITPKSDMIRTLLGSKENLGRSKGSP